MSATAFAKTQFGIYLPTDNVGRPAQFQDSLTGMPAAPSVVGQSGSLQVVLNGQRTAMTAYRNSVAVPIIAADVIASASVPTNSAITEAGSTLANVAYFTAVSAGKLGTGNSPSSPVSVSITPVANQAVRIAITPVANADYYDIFLSTSGTAPLWVGRITSAVLAAGNSIISLVGVVTSNAHGVANTIDIGIVGTGQGSSQPNFSFNNAYFLTSLPTINCAGFDWLHLWVKLVVDDLRTAVAVNLLPFLQSDLSGTDWYAGDLWQAPMLRGEGFPLGESPSVEVSGHDAVIVAASTLTGQMVNAGSGLTLQYQLS